MIGDPHNIRDVLPIFVELLSSLCIGSARLSDNSWSMPQSPIVAETG
jgi:hypothetical protein